MTRSALLLLADSRFPAGAHAMSGGLEAAAAAGRVHDAASLRMFLVGRLHTGGLTAAAFAACACQADRADLLAELDHEYDVRLAAGQARTASRRHGRQFARAARAAWPGPRFDLLAEALPAETLPAEQGPHHPIALGVACAAAGLPAEDAASCAVHGTLEVPAQAAVRLLGLDPVEVAALLAGLAPTADRIAARALTSARMALLRSDPGLLPALGAPLLDLAAQDHATWEVRLFAT
jgi:urease accessory protein